MDSMNEDLRQKALLRLKSVQKMRKLLGGMKQPKFSLFSALNNSLLRLLLIRVARIGEKPITEQDSEMGESDDFRVIEWYRREYFGNLCKWAPDHEDELTQ